ncbi:MAG: protoporphyrinogen oxidase [Bacteroidetes bacterium]|nr:protoporphyrinogen oxidase [Bacteroidota bacterium]
MNTNKNIVILGAGISGLTVAYLLKKEGFNVTVLEKNKKAGGTIETIVENGFLFDKGPNSSLETYPIIKTLIDELKLKDELVYANPIGNKRYILKKGKLLHLPMSPRAFLSTSLFSVKAKLRLLKEPFIGKGKSEESIAEFVKRRIGTEFLDYAISPFVSGVYAGDPAKLSVKFAFPKLYELEQKHRSLILGTIKTIRERKKRKEKSKQNAKMFSFKNGMHTLPNRIAEVLGNSLLSSSEIINIEKKLDGYNILFTQNNEQKEINADTVISTLPAYVLSNLIKNIDEETAKHLNDVFYPSVLVLFLGYKKESVKRKLDGFGFLIPQKEKKSFLGVIWNSLLFPKRTEDDNVCFTLFIGGALNKNLSLRTKEDCITKTIKEFSEIMNIKEEPFFTSTKFWEKAIPQYNIGYEKVDKAIKHFESNNPGFFLGGNYRRGIALGDCLHSAEIICEEVKKYFNLAVTNHSVT